MLWNLACHPALTTCIKNTSVTRLLPSYLSSTNEKLKIYSYGFAFVTNSIIAYYIIQIDKDIDDGEGIKYLLEKSQDNDQYIRSNSIHAICNYIDSDYKNLNNIGRRGIDIIISILDNSYFEEIYYSCNLLYKLIKSECILYNI